jgi:methyl-accepting chemotaxis protein
MGIFSSRVRIDQELPQSPQPETDSASDFSGISAEWLERLQVVSADLRVIAGSTEDEFLAIGARLQDFYQRAAEITSLSHEMVSDVGGDETSTGIKGLTDILDTMESYLRHTEEEADKSTRSLESILSRLGNIAGSLDGFKKLNKTLRMLGISTKIESSRLGESGAGFNSLAEEVTRLSTQVNEKAGTILKQKDELGSVIRKTLTNLVSLEADQHDRVLATINKTRESLSALTGIVDRCSYSASSISTSSEVVKENIGIVVMSMQAHDSVRQQIEHVAEALDDLCARLAAKIADKERGDTPAVDTGPLCELQSAQLRHAADELLSAVDSIIENLREIISTESRLSEETCALAGVADQAGTSFFTEMGQDLSQVTTMLSESADTNRTLSTAMVTVANTVGEIFRFVGEIETIGEEIELIALNAQIQAARTGSEGAALGVLAEAIQRLSVDAMDQTIGVSTTLQSISEVTESMCNGISAEASTMDAESEQMLCRLEGLLQMLQQVNGRMLQCLYRTNEMVNSLSDDIINATSGITVHLKISGVLEEIAMLDSIAEQAKVLIPTADWAGATEKLHELAQRYTMQSERRIHATLVKSPTHGHAADMGHGSNADQVVPPPEEGGEFGDNVELF